MTFPGISVNFLLIALKVENSDSVAKTEPREVFRSMGVRDENFEIFFKTEALERVRPAGRLHRSIQPTGRVD